MKEEKYMVSRMLTPPMIFWDYLSVKEWQQLDEATQDRLVEAAKKILFIK